MQNSLILGPLTELQFEHKKKIMLALAQYLPETAVAYCAELIMLYKLHLHIEVARADRLGDYSPHLGKGNRISINHNLNRYDFLLTFIHELAHHTTHKKYGPNHQSHGKEWKEEFKNCMRPIVMMNIFPQDIQVPLIKHMKSPKYTHSGDVELMKALMKYNNQSSDRLLDDLPLNALFKLTNQSKKVFRKLEKLRSYVMCEEVESGKKYRVHALAKIKEVVKM
jgi:hypothetical protein